MFWWIILFKYIVKIWLYDIMMYWGNVTPVNPLSHNQCCHVKTCRFPFCVSSVLNWSAKYYFHLGQTWYLELMMESIKLDQDIITLLFDDKKFRYDDIRFMQTWYLVHTDVISGSRRHDIWFTQTWYLVYTDMISGSHIHDIWFMQTWYMVHADMICGSYRHDIWFMQTWYQVYADMIYPQ